MKFDGTDTYPVGVLSTIQKIARALTEPGLKGRRVYLARYSLRVERRYLTRQIRNRNWRAVRNSFNGYLAEHGGHPHNCGRGWTKRAAERRAERLCRKASA